MIRDPVLYGLLAAFLTAGALLGMWLLLAVIGLVRAIFIAAGS